MGVSAIGLAALAGWTLGGAFLKSPFPGVVEMKANAAIGFVALGASLGLTRSALTGWPPRAARAPALLAGVIGTLTRLEYLSERNLRIDQLRFRDTHSLHTVNPGRPAPQTAVVFVLQDTALWVLNSARVAKSQLPRALVGTSFVIMLFAGIGYEYGISGFTGVPSLTLIALYSALAFIVLFVAVLSLTKRLGQLLTKPGLLDRHATIVYLCAPHRTLRGEEQGWLSRPNLRRRRR